jgi:hypothetical protein
MKERIKKLESALDESNKDTLELSESIKRAHAGLNNNSGSTILLDTIIKNPLDKNSGKIAILVIACNRQNAIENHLRQLIERRAKTNNIEKFPIIVSQDCNHAETARSIEKFSQSLFAFVKVG